jgi:hypothetical protein
MKGLLMAWAFFSSFQIKNFTNFHFDFSEFLTKNKSMAIKTTERVFFNLKIN